LVRCGVRVSGESLATGASGTGSIGAVVAELMLAGLGDVRCGAGEEVEGVEGYDLRAVVNRVRAEDLYLGSIVGARTGVGDRGSEQVAEDAFCGPGLIGEHADGCVCREARVLPGVHGVYKGGGDVLVTEEEVEDAASEGVLEQEGVDGGYGEKGII